MRELVERLLRWLEKPERDIEILRAVKLFQDEPGPYPDGHCTRQRASERLRKPMSIGEFYSRLGRLEDRGQVVTWPGETTEARRGAPKMLIKLTEAGHARLREESP